MPLTEDCKIIIRNVQIIQYVFNINLVVPLQFYPIGAHESGIIGKSPNGVSNNLIPYILDVATKKEKN